MPSFAHSKCQGEWVELRFAAECLARQYSVSKPYGDSTPYDFIVDPRPYPVIYGATNARIANKKSPGVLRDLGGKAVCQQPEASSQSLKRIQVKSVSARSRDGAWHIAAMRSVASRKKPYRLGDFDFLAAYIIPLDLWYVVPIAEIAGIMMLAFAPGRPQRRLEKYREAWHLLKGG